MIFYDCECFAHDWLVVFIDPSNRETTIIQNNEDQLLEFYEANKGDIWVGFNSNHYDVYIIQGILCGFDPKKISDYIIVKDKPGWMYSSLLKKFPILNYDVMLNNDKGLKSFEGFLGSDIQETSVPFDIDRKLTKSEMDETIKYCIHDVEQTMEVFLQRTAEFDTMMYFIKHFKLPISYISKTKAQLAAIILGGNRKGRKEEEFDFQLVDCLRVDKYKYIADWYSTHHNYSEHQDVIVAGVPHTYSWGGGHGALPKYHDTGAFMMIDVTGYYPSMQMRFHFGYRVMDHPENFEFIHKSNLEFKRKGDKKARQPFKIMDNAISGQMKQPSSTLYDPMSNNNICINGQMLLLDLIEHLEPYVKLIQNNTDGILVKPYDYDRDFDRIDDTVWEWEQRTGMEMEFDTFFGELFQKDVNNYLIIDRYTGDYKAKGSYLKKLGPLDYDLPIINKALKQYMIERVSVKETINSCNNLKEFQLVAKISSKYTCIMYGAEELKERCIRVFASKNQQDPGVYKIHAATNSLNKIANSPEHCFIYNDTVNGVPVPDLLDRQWYIDLANKRLASFGVNV